MKTNEDICNHGVKENISSYCEKLHTWNMLVVPTQVKFTGVPLHVKFISHAGNIWNISITIKVIYVTCSRKKFRLFNQRVCLLKLMNTKNIIIINHFLLFLLYSTTLTRISITSHESSFSKSMRLFLCDGRLYMSRNKILMPKWTTAYL